MEGRVGICLFIQDIIQFVFSECIFLLLISKYNKFWLLWIVKIFFLISVWLQ